VRREGRTTPLHLPPVIGHRGAAGRAPENTLAGLSCAKALGCTWVEFDVRLTADGVPVLCHDRRLDRTTNGSGVVATLPLAAVRDRDAGSRFAPEFAGERVPTLDEALLLCAALDLGANIEVKADSGREYATAAAVATVLRQLGDRGPQVLVSSFLLPALVALHEVAPWLPRGVLFRVVPRNWADTAARFKCRVVGADHRRLRASRIAAIRTAGYSLAAYTVNDPERADLLFGWGVTSVFSDIPDIILQGSAGHSPTRAVAAASRIAAAR
jgi:glycerophosphoryl diester phosphodiesterase